MSARTLALEALYAWHDADTHAEKREAKVLGRKAISALEAETGEPVIYCISYDGKTPYNNFCSDRDTAEETVKRVGGTAVTMPLYAAPPPAEPVAWAMHRADGLILDVICPEEHASHAGAYTIPLYRRLP